MPHPCHTCPGISFFHRFRSWVALGAATAMAAIAPTGAAVAQQGVLPAYQPVDMPEHVYDGGWEHFVGGGMAVFDCNQDGLPDIFAAGGERPAALLVNRSQVRGDIRFVGETPEALKLTGLIGAYPLDVDSDGFSDLAILRVGTNLILRGGPACSFAPYDGFADDYKNGWTTAFSATWEGAKTLPTLAFGNYVDRQNPEGPFGTCDTSFLYRPKGAAYDQPLPLGPGFCPLSMLFSDWSRTGRADLRLSNDRHYYLNDGQEQMWLMGEEPRLYQPEDGWTAFKLWGMGIASRDMTGDGMPDVYLTSMGDQRLQIRDTDKPGPAFRDAPYDMGTTAHRPYTGDDGRPSTGWHVEFGDAQNDGLDDIFVTKGNVQQMPGSAMNDPNNLLVQGPSGRFAEMGELAGIASMARGRGGAFVDFNLDGLLDIAVVNRRDMLEMFQNVTADAGNAVQIRLAQPGVNRDAIGAWIELRAGDTVQVRELTVGGGHAGGKLGLEHFGIGDVPDARFRVIWPDQTVSDWAEIRAGRIVLATRTGDDLILSDY